MGEKSEDGRKKKERKNSQEKEITGESSGKQWGHGGTQALNHPLRMQGTSLLAVIVLAGLPRPASTRLPSAKPNCSIAHATPSLQVDRTTCMLLGGWRPLPKYHFKQMQIRRVTLAAHTYCTPCPQAPRYCLHHCCCDADSGTAGEGCSVSVQGTNIAGHVSNPGRGSQQVLCSKTSPAFTV